MKSNKKREELQAHMKQMKKSSRKKGSKLTRMIEAAQACMCVCVQYVSVYLYRDSTSADRCHLIYLSTLTQDEVASFGVFLITRPLQHLVRKRAPIEKA